MRRLLITFGAAGLLSGCVVAATPVVATRPPPITPVAATDPWCQQERREARVSQQMANQEAREAGAYGGRRQANEAAAAQSSADRQRMQAQRAS